MIDEKTNNCMSTIEEFFLTALLADKSPKLRCFTLAQNKQKVPENGDDQFCLRPDQVNAHGLGLGLGGLGLEVGRG